MSICKKCGHEKHRPGLCSQLIELSNGEHDPCDCEIVNANKADSEVFYLVERVQQKSGEAPMWWIGENNWTENFHEIPMGFRFPTKYHAAAILRIARDWQGQFRAIDKYPNQNVEYCISEHCYFSPEKS